MITKGIAARRICALFAVASLMLAALFSAFTAPAAPVAACELLSANGDCNRSPVATAPSGINIAQGTLLDTEKTAEISTAELQQILATKSATVFDARPYNEFAVGHIPGALTVAAKPGVSAAQHVSDVAEVGRLVVSTAPFLGYYKDAPIVVYCNGPFGGLSKRLSEQLVQAGYTNVRRYQLGMPTWRALVGVTQIELEGVRYVMGSDKTAVVFDARTAEEFTAGSLPGARNLILADLAKAKTDGRLPMEDHNTRIIVFAKDAVQARAMVDALAKSAFDNVSFYAGSLDTLMVPAATAP